MKPISKTLIAFSRPATRLAVPAIIALTTHSTLAEQINFDTDSITWFSTYDPFFGDVTAEGIGVFNFTDTKTHFVDTNHATNPATNLTNATVLDGNAWYGPAEDGFHSFIDFFDFKDGFADTVTFNIAVANADGFIDVAFEGLAPDTFFVDTFPLDNSFDLPGGGTGSEGTVTVNAADYGLAGLLYVDIWPNPSFTGNVGIDNIFVNEIPSHLDPLNSNVLPGDGVGTLTGVEFHWLRLPMETNGSFEVTNDGTGATTYDVSYSGSVFDPGFDVPGTADIDINPGQTLNPGAAFGFDLDQPSGTYTGTVTIHNSLNPTDPDDDVTVTYEVHDPAILTANNSAPLNVNLDDQATVANQEPEPHAGALRASAKVLTTEISGNGFAIEPPPGDPASAEGDLAVDELVFAGDAPDAATITHDPAGLLSGRHFGLLTVTFEMQSHDGSFLTASGTDIDPIEWQLESTVTGSTGGFASREAGESYATLGAELGDTTVEILDGVSSTDDQLIFMVFDTIDPSGTDAATAPLGTPVDVTFNTPGDVFVIQISYDDTDITPTEEDALRLLFFDEGTEDYINAVLANSNAGSVGDSLFFEKSYADYLATDAPGGVFQLGAHGLDTTTNTAWAAIDHNTLFAVGEVPEPTTLFLLTSALLPFTTRNRHKNKLNKIDDTPGLLPTNTI